MLSFDLLSFLLIFLLSFVSSIIGNLLTVVIFLNYGININIGDLSTYNAILTAGAVGPCGALINFIIIYIVMKYNVVFAEKLKVFLKPLFFMFAGGFSSYLTDKILPINNDALDIKDKLDMELVRIKASLTSMLLCSFVIGLIFSYISSSIKIFMDKKNESNGSSLPDLVLQQQQETNNNTNMNFRESIVWDNCFHIVKSFIFLHLN